MTAEAGLVLKTEHTGLTVESIDESLEFWNGVLGFELEYRKELGGGEAMENIVGVPGANLRNALLRTPDGYGIELLEYSGPAYRKTLDQRPCDAGAAHLTFAVSDIELALERSAAVGWRPEGAVVQVPSGMKVVYVRGPDGHTVEFMQSPQ